MCALVGRDNVSMDILDVIKNHKDDLLDGLQLLENGDDDDDDDELRIEGDDDGKKSIFVDKIEESFEIDCLNILGRFSKWYTEYIKLLCNQRQTLKTAVSDKHVI